MKTSRCCMSFLKYDGTEVYRCAGCNQQCDAAGTPLAWTVAEERDKYRSALRAILATNADDVLTTHSEAEVEMCRLAREALAS
jgi:hypothetical protein